MKSYLRFLSRNKLYTAIEVVGLSLALAFVIVLSSYIVDDMSTNNVLKNTDDIYLVHSGDYAHTIKELPELYGSMPEIESSCSMVQSGRSRKSFFGELTTASYGENQTFVSTFGVSDTFFDFFTLPFSEGNPKSALASRNSVVISEDIANVLFPDGDAIGKEIVVFEENQRKEEPDQADFNVSLTVSGIFKPGSKTVFFEPDIIMRYDLVMEQQENMFEGSSYMGEYSFIRLRKGSNPVIMAGNLTEQFLKIYPHYNKNHSKVDLKLTGFDDIKKQDPRKFGYSFKHIRQGKLFNIYLIMCIFITIVSLLDYIVLTIAFSRFRIKEIATRQLLGTDRKKIIGRCFAEAFMLLAVSCAFAVIIAIAFKNPIGQILGAEINPLSHLNEYLMLISVILAMVGLAGAVPSLILSSYNAVNVIKGEARYRYKVTFGKVFIGFAGFLSILAMSICFGISRQTRHLVNQPLGHNIDDILYIEVADDYINLIYDKLASESYIDKVGMTSSLPSTQAYTMTSIRNGNGKRETVHFIECTEEAREILGIEILEDFKVASVDPYIGKWFMTKSAYEVREGYVENGNLKLHRHQPLCGVVSDFKIGPLKSGSTGTLTLFKLATEEAMFEWGGLPIVKVNISESKAKQNLVALLESMNYTHDMFRVSSLREAIEENIKEEKNMLKLLTGFSLICLLMTILTIVGLGSYYGKISEKDNAIRNVFGCSKREMILKIILNFGLPAIIPAIAAIPIAYTVIGRWLEGYVVRTDNSPAIYITALALVISVVVVSILIQTFRMLRTNPAEALKKE